ncbi:MAG: right-handed parallel beta-helix repeat-containing protein, partial [Ferruginibacter sp.]
AAEILRYTNAGWKPSDIESFSNMLLTVYYPLMRFYFPQANGNWDGAIIHSIMAIAIFTDNRTMFNNAVNHFMHAPVNGSLLKYIYPNGQCQESPRDQGHVQLGLGEFAGAAQIAFTQGVDLFSIAGNRLALGYEYTAKFLLGTHPHCYCTISEKAKNIRDCYEYVYRHYTAMGMDMPWTKIAADSMRAKASRSLLSAIREPSARPVANRGVPRPGSIGYIAGATDTSATIIPGNALIVVPGQSIQDALNAAGGTGKWVLLKKGLHVFPATLKIPGGITLAGEGSGTILFLDTASGSREAMVNADVNLKDVVIRDLVIEGSNRTSPTSDPNSSRSNKGGYNRGGIVFRSLVDGQMKNISLVNITVRNCTFNGVLISGAENLNISNCDLNENGGNVVPGPKLQHNLLLTHCAKVKITGSRMATSPFGSGIALDHCTNIFVSDCEITRNAWYGLLVTESSDITVNINLIEANDRSGIILEFLRKGSANIMVNNNLVQYNAGYGVESYAARNAKVENNKYEGNGNRKEQQKLSSEKLVLME